MKTLKVFSVHDKQVVTACGMVELALVQAANHMLSGVPKRLKYFQSLLVYVVRIEVLSHCAVVHVRQLALVGLLIEEKVVDIYQVDVSNLLLSLLVPNHP